jgi:hypothetical protein
MDEYREPVSVVGVIATGPPNLEPFLRAFAAVASRYTWLVDRRGRLRTAVEGVMVCPMMLLGWHNSPTRPKTMPDTKTLGPAVGYTDREAAAIVHIADSIISSRYYDKTIRARLLSMCKIDVQADSGKDTAP